MNSFLRYKAIAIFLISFFCFNGFSSASDISENDLLSSAEKVVALWEEMLTNGHLCYRLDSGPNSWKAYRHEWVGPASFDIKKTDSIVSPYLLIISFYDRSCGDNALSPSANGRYSDYFRREIGFKTAEEALLNKDFERCNPKEDGLVSKRIIQYALQKGSWVVIERGEAAYFYFGNVWTPCTKTEGYIKALTIFPIK